MVRQKYEMGNGLIDTNAFVTQIASDQLNYLVYRGIVHTFHLPIAGGTRLYSNDIQDTLIGIKCPISWGIFAELPFFSQKFAPKLLTFFFVNYQHFSALPSPF